MGMAGCGVGLKSSTPILVRDAGTDWTRAWRRREHKDEAVRDVKMLALNTVVTWPQTKERLQPRKLEWILL